MVYGYGNLWGKRYRFTKGLDCDKWYNHTSPLFSCYTLSNCATLRMNVMENTPCPASLRSYGNIIAYDYNVYANHERVSAILNSIMYGVKSLISFNTSESPIHLIRFASIQCIQWVKIVSQLVKCRVFGILTLSISNRNLLILLVNKICLYSMGKLCLNLVTPQR